MKVDKLPVGSYQANCYIVEDGISQKALVIDPGAEFEVIWRRIHQLKLSVDKIVLTHAHIDHVGAVRQLAKQTRAPIYMSREDHPLLLDSYHKLDSGKEIQAGDRNTFFLKDGDEIENGEVRLKVIPTPGHTPGGICLLSDGVLFTGDTLFNGSIGRTDFPYASLNQLMESIIQRILPLPDNTKIHPGHGSSTNLAEEKSNNPFLQSDFLMRYKD